MILVDVLIFKDPEKNPDPDPQQCLSFRDEKEGLN